MDHHVDGEGSDFDDEEDGLIYLNDVSFDFDDYFDRARKEELTSEEFEVYDARVIGLYCRSVYRKEVPPTWVMERIANEFFKVLAGGDWNDSFPLPWNPMSEAPMFGGSRATKKAFEMYGAIYRLLDADKELKVTEAIQRVADENHVSYETARAAWYKYKNQFKKH